MHAEQAIKSNKQWRGMVIINKVKRGTTLETKRNSEFFGNDKSGGDPTAYRIRRWGLRRWAHISNVKWFFPPDRIPALTRTIIQTITDPLQSPFVRITIRHHRLVIETKWIMMDDWTTFNPSLDDFTVRPGVSFKEVLLKCHCNLYCVSIFEEFRWKASKE